MPDGGASIIGGLVSGAGSLIGGSQQASAQQAANTDNLEIARETNALSASEAQMNRNFALDNSTHVFQRGVADMKAAGLNPILAAGSPDPMATGVQPSFTTATMQPVNSGYVGKAMDAAVTNYSALQGARQTAAAVDKTQADTNLSNTLAAKAAADTTSALEVAKNVGADTSLKLAKLPSAQLESAAAKALQPLTSNATDSISSKLSDIISGINTNSAAKIPPPPTPSQLSPKLNPPNMWDVSPDGQLSPMPN